MIIKYGYRSHRGSLVDSLKTSIYFDSIYFYSILDKYEFYCYDERVNQLLFINVDEEYTWLFIELCSNLI